MTTLDSAVEALSAVLHAIYQREAQRQADAGDDEVRHPDDYEALQEHTKDYDRVLARFIIERERVMAARIEYLEGECRALESVVIRQGRRLDAAGQHKSAGGDE